jgi:hypothetical protein
MDLISGGQGTLISQGPQPGLEPSLSCRNSC